MALASRPLPKGRLVEISLLHLLFWATGLGSLFGFYALCFPPLAIEIAADYAWEGHNPFEHQSGIALFALGVLGVLCVWLRGVFWVATIVLALVMGWTDAGTVFLNGAPGYQVWVNFLWDGVGTVILLIFLLWYRARAGYERFWSV